jgi:predicted lactoylglutathione lyase
VRQIFVNLPVKDLERSKRFLSSLGFGFDSSFTPRAVADAKRTSEVRLALSCSSEREVDDLVARATAASGRPIKEPQDHGFMYHRSFEDPEGHIWELLHMRSEPQ